MNQARGVLYFANNQDNRIVEAYIGEYASGKSEMAINRAMELREQGRQVTLVDLDTVEPFYTLRVIKKVLEAKGINMISYDREDSFGLGETGAMLNPKARWALKNEGDVILDIGYGVHGARTLNLVEGAYESPELQIIVVMNGTRPMTDSPEKVREYLQELGRVDAIVLNTHLAEQSTTAVILAGNRMIAAVAQEEGIPVAYMAINQELTDMAAFEDENIPIKYIKRYMPAAIW